MFYFDSIKKLLIILISAFNIYGQNTTAKIVSQVNANKNGVILYIKNELKLPEINTVLGDRSLLGWNPIVLDLESAGPDLSWRVGDNWALYYMGQMVISGEKMPKPDELERAFVRADIPNRILFLRNFLVLYPNNLDAKLALMMELHRYAYQRTGKALNIEQKEIRSDLSLIGGSTIAPDIKKMLAQKDDENIWGDLAMLLNVAFSSDEWLTVLPDFFSRLHVENMALYSPIMRGVYKKNIYKVENELKKRQTDNNLWQMWQVLAQATERRILNFFPELPEMPAESSYAWPPIKVINWMKEESKLVKDWSKIIELEWPWWPNLQTSLNQFAPVGTIPELITEALSIQKDFFWKRRLWPLLEACLYNRDFDKADEIYFDISSRPIFEREAKQAFDLAKVHKHTFPNVLHELYSKAIEIEPFLFDSVAGDRAIINPKISRLKDLSYRGYLDLIVIDPSKTTSKEQITSILFQDKLPEYAIVFRNIMEPNQPVAMELIEREALSLDTFIWGILDDNTKYYHGGNSLPAANNIMELILSMKRRTRLDIFREFVKNNPESITAKIILLQELGHIGHMRTSKADMDMDNMLDVFIDSEIWGEYINIASSIFSQILLRSDSANMLNTFDLPFIKNSRLLKQFALKHIESIESALWDRPHSRGLWELWGIFSPFLPDRSLTSFMTSLTPVPDLSGFPPAFLYPELIKNYQSIEAWSQIIKLAGPIWDSIQDIFDRGENIQHRLTDTFWEQYIKPLCDAYEKTGQTQRAEKIMSIWEIVHRRAWLAVNGL
jgi:hypothetical protein